MPAPFDLDAFIQPIGAVPGVLAVVLGGSRGRGTAGPNSDYDLGLYYAPEHPIDTTVLLAAVKPRVDTPDDAAVTKLGAWGPFVNGGAWLTVSGCKVDLLYRDISAVTAVITECRAGRFSMNYQQGHAHGFCSTTWMGEVALCQPLLDPQGAIARAKALTAPYPQALGRALIQRFQSEALFSVQVAQTAVSRGEQNFVAGCAYRALSCIAQVLFAANQRYLINEKGALAESAGFPARIPNLLERVQELWRAVGDAQLLRAVELLGTIHADLADVVAA